MEKFSTIHSTVIPIPQRNIDTDQIIPARFLKVVDKEGLAAGLFADWRYDVEGAPISNFALNQSRHQNAQILLVDENFGCGSSREHAAWALVGWGIRAVVAPSFADIFKGNALKNQLLPVALPDPQIRQLFSFFDNNPSANLTIDLELQTVLLPDETNFQFEVDHFARYCLLNGLDQLGYLLSHEKAISAYEEMHK